MKRNILKITFIAAVAVAAGYTAYSQSQKAEAVSDLTMDNVEALAQYEIRCVDVTGGTLFYCVSDLMRSCYCDGLRPGRGYYRTNTLN